MLRRRIRERREFIYRKSEQARARKTETAKRKAREDAGLHLEDKLNKPTYEEQEQMKLRKSAECRTVGVVLGQHFVSSNVIQLQIICPVNFDHTCQCLIKHSNAYLISSNEYQYLSIHGRMKFIFSH